MAFEFRKVKYLTEYDIESYPLNEKVDFDTIGVYENMEGIEQEFVIELEPDEFLKLIKDFIETKL